MRRSGSGLVYTAFCLVLAAVAANVAVDKHLSADGVDYLVKMVDSGWFANVSWSRRHAEWLMEWPVVAAMRMGVAELRVLGGVFSASICLLYVLSFGLSAFAVRGERKSLLWFPVVSMVVVNLGSDYILTGEFQTMALCTWPILLLLLRRAAWTAGDMALLFALLAAYTRMYETACIAATVLAVCSAWRARNADRRREAVAAVAVVILCLACAVVAVYYCINPCNLSNRNSFLNALLLAFRSPELNVCAASIALYAAGVMTKMPWLRLSAAVPIAVYGLWCVPCGIHANANSSFNCRTATLTVLPVLMLLAIAASRGAGDHAARGAFVACALVAVMAAGSFRDSMRWLDFKRDFKRVLSTHAGYVRIEDTSLDGHPCGWPWNNGLLGLVWSGPRVTAIILDRPGQAWMPCDLRVDRPLSRYRDYAAIDGINRAATVQEIP